MSKCDNEEIFKSVLKWLGKTVTESLDEKKLRTSVHELFLSKRENDPGLTEQALYDEVRTAVISDAVFMMIHEIRQDAEYITATALNGYMERITEPERFRQEDTWVKTEDHGRL